MVYKSSRVDENRERLLSSLSRHPLLPFDAAAAEEFGRITVELARTGRPIPHIDRQIAAIARVHNLVCLTADRHFAHVPQLRTENWLA